MIAATQFFQEEGEHEQDDETKTTFLSSAWKQVSPVAWRLAPSDPSASNSPSSMMTMMTTTTGVPAGEDVHEQAALASMDRFLGQQQSQAQPTIMPASNSNNSTDLLTGFIAGLDISDPRDRWVRDIQAFLLGNTQQKQDEGSKNMLYGDRQGVVVSAPLRLSTKTLSKYLLATRAVKPINQTGPTPTTTNFCLDALRPGGPECPHMNFLSYTRSRSTPLRKNTDAYVPEGYEDFEALGKENEEKKEEPGKDTSLTYFIMEIQHQNETSSALNSSCGTTTLEDVACIWNEGSGDMIADGGVHSNNHHSAKGIRVKIITRSTWKEILDQQSQRASDSEFSWLLSALETTPPLSLPQPVGGDERSSISSLLLIVSFKSEAKVGSGDHSGKARLLSQLQQQRITHGNIVLKFQHSQSIKDPICSRISMAKFVIGRKFQVMHHQSSEEDVVLKILQASMLNAERFIPARLKNQWDLIPDALISVVPHPLLPRKIAQWLLDPLMRRSDFDLSLGNVLPPESLYVDKTMLTDNLWNSVISRAADIRQKVASTKNIASKEGARKRESDVSANGIYTFCTLSTHMEKSKSERKAANMSAQYVRKLLLALQVERFRCFEDMKKHDMYSIHWKDNAVAIPPPTRPHNICPECCVVSSSLNVDRCAYHTFCAAVENETGRRPAPGKSVFVRTRKQLETFALLLSRMRHDDCIVVNIHVPGVAENFPLVSVGDFTRLLFKSPDNTLTTEVIAEVADVVIKSEELVIRLPSPFQRKNGLPYCNMASLPYLQALLHTKQFVVDAVPIINALLHGRHVQTIAAQAISEPERKESLDRVRFSIRFNFQGGRGFDIIRHRLKSATQEIGSMGKVFASKNCNEQQRERRLHLSRVIVPTIERLQDVQSATNRATLESGNGQNLQFEHPINSQQQHAVVDIVNKNHGSAPYIIEGPAGTGKTMCVCEAIIQVYQTSGGKANILVCAPSDAACDVLASRLLPHLPQKSLIRLNWWSRKVESMKPELLSVSPMDHQTGVFTIPTFEQLQQSRVVVCQCFVAECLELVGPFGYLKKHFSHLFIDECNLAMECESLVPILSVGSQCSLILVGDTKQLSPVIRDPAAAAMGLGLSIQERLLKLPLYTGGMYCTSTRLVSNYRSNEALLTVPSSLFYSGKLEAMAPQAVANPFEHLGDLGAAGFPLLLCDVPHGEERSKLDTPSFYNMEECYAISSLAKALLRCKTKAGVSPLHTGEIAVITPFRAQVLALRVTLRQANLGGINVGVVEDFQGQEAKVVLISTVLTRDHSRWKQPTASAPSSDSASATSSAAHRLGFLHDPKSFNVAITRAHALCIIVGHADYLEQSGTYWAALMDHIRRNDGVLGDEGEGDDDEKEYEDGELEDDPYGIADLMRRVEALQLLGSGTDEDRHDLSYYYSDIPQWKVMLC